MTGKNILCFGEVLWDMLPSGKLLGGAPLNVLIHARQMGIDGDIISAIGDDQNGKDLLRILSERAIATHYITILKEYPTGRADVYLDESGSASYRLIEPCAYDFIDASQELLDGINHFDALIFGSLACRNSHSMNTLFNLLQHFNGIKILDVNLRPPHYRKSTIISLIEQADILKVNEDELLLLSEWFSINGSSKQKLRAILSHLELNACLCTLGAEGVLYADKNQIIHQASPQIEVVDTIGAGDAFLAAFISGFLKGEEVQSTLETATRVGAYVAMQSGATPKLDFRAIRSF